MERGTPYSVIAVRANDDLRTGPTQTRAHAFSAAGLFYTGKELCISTAKKRTHSTIHPHIPIHLTGRADEIKCFHCGAFRGWQNKNDPRREQGSVPELRLHPLRPARESATR
jgi:hypothetical protein